MPGFIFSSVFYVGAGCIAWHAFQATYNLIKRARTYFKSLSNAKQYLKTSPQPQEGMGEMTYSAVVYGAATTAGKMFCTYLAQQGFNLIVVERDLSVLQQIETTLIKELDKNLRVTKVCIDKFD